MQTVHRIFDYSFNVVKSSVQYNLPAKIVMETINILKKYGMSGLAGVLMRHDFLEAVETLKKMSGMVSVDTSMCTCVLVVLFYLKQTGQALCDESPRADCLHLL